MITDMIELKDQAGNGPVWINPMYIISMKGIKKRMHATDSLTLCGTKIIVDKIVYQVSELPGEVNVMIVVSNNKKLKSLAEVTELVV